MANSADCLKTPSKQTDCDWIKKGLEYLEANRDMVKGSFSVTGLSLSLDGSENSVFRNDKQLQSTAEEDQCSSDDPFVSDSDSDPDSHSDDSDSD